MAVRFWRAICLAVVLQHLALGPSAWAAVPSDPVGDEIGEDTYAWQDELGEAFKSAYMTETDTSVLAQAVIEMMQAQAKAAGHAIAIRFPHYAGTWSATATGTETSGPDVDKPVPSILMELDSEGGEYKRLWWKSGPNAADWKLIAGSGIDGSVSVTAPFSIRAATSTATTTSTGPVAIGDNPIISGPTSIVTDTDLVHTTATVRAEKGVTVRAATDTATSTGVSIASDPTIGLAYGTTVEPVGTDSASGTTNQPADSGHRHPHGNLPGGSLHDVVTTLVNGFMSAADKVIVNALAAATLKAGSGIALKGTGTATSTEVLLKDSPTVEVDSTIARKTDSVITTNTNAITSTGLTAGRLLKASAVRGATDSLVSDDGTTVGVLGHLSLSGKLYNTDGNEVAPSVTWNSDSGAGFFHNGTAGAGAIGVSINGGLQGYWASSGYVSWGDIKALRKDTAAEVFRAGPDGITAVNIVTTPAASAIPKAYTDHTIDDGWIKSSIARATDPRFGVATNFGLSIQSVGTANSAGTGTSVARDTHRHDHGAQPEGDGTNHAAVTASHNGFATPAMLAASTSAITGSGTAGYHLKFTGTRAVGNSIVYDDGTNASVGYGTSLITNYRLTVNGGLGVLGRTDASGGFNGPNGSAALPAYSLANPASGMYGAGTGSGSTVNFSVNGAQIGYFDARNFGVFGNIGTSSTFIAPNGAESAPSYTFSGDPTAGISHLNSGASALVAFSVNGGYRGYWSNSGLTVMGSLDVQGNGTFTGTISASNITETAAAGKIPKANATGVLSGEWFPHTTSTPKGIGSGTPGAGSSGYLPREDHRHPAQFVFSWAAEYPADGLTHRMEMHTGTQFSQLLQEWPVALDTLPEYIKIRVQLASYSTASEGFTFTVGSTTSNSVSGAYVLSEMNTNPGGTVQLVYNTYTGILKPTACNSACYVQVWGRAIGSSYAALQSVTVSITADD